MRPDKWEMLAMLLGGAVGIVLGIIIAILIWMVIL